MAKRSIQDNLDPLLSRHALPRVHLLGRSIFDPIWAERDHASQWTEVVHVLRGQVRVVTPTYTIVGREGDTIYTPAGMTHRDVFPQGTIFEVYLVHLDWAGESQLLKRIAPPRLSAISTAAKVKIAADFKRLFVDFQHHGSLQRELTSLRILQIILTMLQGAEAGQTSQSRGDHGRQTQIMIQARRLIDAHFHEPLSLEQIADRLGISAYYLSRVFSEESGFTLSNYLTTVRMERAAHLLRDGRHNVAEAARAVGYRDPHYFSRVFRAQFGQSPSAYRAGAR